MSYDTSDADDDSRPWNTIQYIATGQAGGFPQVSGLVSDDANPLLDLIYALKDEYAQNAVWTSGGI